MKTPEEVEKMRDQQAEEFMQTKDVFHLTAYYWLNWVLRKEK